MGKLDICSGLVSPVSVLLILVGVECCVVCIIILNYADLSPICLREIAAQWADISRPG